MTIQDWGAIGELVAAIATVATLAYLATQIRYARLAASDASRQGRASGVVGMLQMEIGNAEYRKAWRKADKEDEGRLQDLAERLGVTPDEAGLVFSGCLAWAYLHWAQYRSMKTEEDDRELRDLVAVYYSRTPMSIVWEHDVVFRSMLDSGFVAWVESILAAARQE